MAQVSNLPTIDSERLRAFAPKTGTVTVFALNPNHWQAIVGQVSDLPNSKRGDCARLLLEDGKVPVFVVRPANFHTEETARSCPLAGASILWQNTFVLQSLTERKEWKFFAVLPKADPGLAAAWWTALLLRGILPAAFAIAMGVLVGAVQRGHPLAGPLAFAGAIFVLLQVLSPIHQAVSANLGDRTAAWLYDRLTEACVRPPGMGHLEDPDAHQRPHRRARLRPRNDRPAAVDLHGFHRQRHGRDDRRRRVRA